MVNTDLIRIVAGLGPRWDGFLKKELKVSDDSVFPLITGSNIGRAYADEFWRHYYTPFYLHELLNAFETARSKVAIEYPVYMEFAIWLSRISYSAGKHTSSSSDWASAWLAILGASEKAVYRIARLIKLGWETPEPYYKRLSEDEKLMWDLYHHRLGLSYDIVLGDEINKRKECIHIENTAYLRKRGRFLMRLRAPERLYRTKYFYDLYENQAQENLAQLQRNMDQVANAHAKAIFV